MDTDLIVRKIKENKKIAWATLAIVVLIILILLTSFTKKSVVPAQGPVDIKGKFACLPYTNNASSTDTCTLGIKEGGNYYAIDVSSISLAVTDLKANDDIQVSGDFLPIAQLQSNSYKEYDIAGIIKVESLTRSK